MHIEKTRTGNKPQVPKKGAAQGTSVPVGWAHPSVGEVTQNVPNPAGAPAPVPVLASAPDATLAVKPRKSILARQAEADDVTANGVFGAATATRVAGVTVASDMDMFRTKNDAVTLDADVPIVSEASPVPAPDSVAASGKTGKVNNKRKKRNKRKTPIWQVIMLIVGLAMLAWPIVADRISAYQADQAITSYTQQISEDPAEINKLLDEAQVYNDKLSGTPNDYDGAVPPAGDLIVSGGLPFSWIEFPTLAEKLPIYHGTSDTALQAGVGNLEMSSLPIGGASSHSVLTGHSGMPGSRMFDDIDRLEIGDVFMIHTLNLDMAYKVISTEVVLPDKVDSLAIQPGRDLVTLVTCTPYGVNSHRLLVHAERTDYDAALELPSNNMALFFNQRTLPFIAAVIALVLFFFAITVRRRMKYPLELGVSTAWNGLSDYTDDKRRYVGEKNRI